MRSSVYSIFRCPACGLQFSDPMRAATYSDAYDQKQGPPEVVGEGLPFLGWTEDAQEGLPEHGSFLTAAQDFALQLVRDRVNSGPPPRALEIGFGAGWFLGALRSAGFSAYGLEVADAPVALLQRKGFAVGRTGNGFTAKIDAANLALVASFEVLEHVENPIGFLSSVHREYPCADVVLSVPDERRWFLLGGREAHDYPPNHLTRWSELALRLALQRAGFRFASVWNVSSSAQEISMASMGRFLPFKSAGRGQKISSAVISTTLSEELRKRTRRKKLAVPVSWMLRLLGKTACSMVAMGSNQQLPEL